LEFDYIIVGAGSAGCVVADLLSRDGENSVCVVEAGGSDRKFWVKVPVGYGRLFSDQRYNWKFKTEPDPACNQRRAYWPRGKIVGGSSSINALVYVRGLPHDFDDWESSGAKGWGWRDVLPHFQQIEQRIASDGTISGQGPLAISDVSNKAHPINQVFQDAAGEIGIRRSADFNGEDPEGVGHYQITTKNGLRCSAADAFLRPALKRRNVKLLRDTMVQKILFDSKSAIGVAVSHKKMDINIRARKEVIVCAGAIGSPQLLQVSGIGSADHLQALGINVVKDNPNVGRHLQDHLAVNYYYKATKPTLNNQLSTPIGRLWAGIKYVLTRGGPLSLSVNQFGGFTRSHEKLCHADTQLYMSPMTFCTSDPEKDSRVNPDPFSGFLLSYQPSRPTSTGDINICSADNSVPPTIRANSLSTQQDIDDALASGRILQKLTNTAALKNLILEPVGPDITTMNDAEIIADFRERCSTVFHPVSTCRMGATDESSVVSSDMKVHGVNALRIIDASTFPNITSGNTNAPTIMLAHKAATEMLAE